MRMPLKKKKMYIKKEFLGQEMISALGQANSVLSTGYKRTTHSHYSHGLESVKAPIL